MKLYVLRVSVVLMLMISMVIANSNFLLSCIVCSSIMQKYTECQKVTTLNSQ